MGEHEREPRAHPDVHVLSESDSGINIRADRVTILVTLRIFVAHFCQISLLEEQ